MNVQVNNVWPSTLPLPHIDYSGGPTMGALVSDRTHGRLARRRRFYPAYQNFQVQFVLTPFQHDIFRAFHLDDLGNGTSTFALELRYPKNSAVTNWQVRFLGEIRSTYNDGSWMVDATICLLHPVVIIEPRDAVPTEPESGDPVQGGDDQIYYPGEWSCGAGIPSTFFSSYVWSLPEDVDPNEGIIAEYRAHARAIFISERDENLEGLTIHIYSEIFWDFYPTPIYAKSGLYKAQIGNTDHNDPEGDFYILVSNGHWKLTQHFCFS